MAVKKNVFLWLALLTSTIWLNACSSVAQPEKAAEIPASPERTPENVFDRYLQTESPPANGFDFPFDNNINNAASSRHNGWSVVSRFAEKSSLGINPGEDWEFAGDESPTQTIYAVAGGRVIAAQNLAEPWGKVMVIEHTFYENHEKRKLHSLYAQLSEINLQVGDDVRMHQPIAALKRNSDDARKLRLHVELRWNEKLSPAYSPSADGKDLMWIQENYASPTEFINAHRKLFTPQQESALLLVHQDSYKMRLYQTGKLLGEYDISLGQGKGQKRVQGDNKTPKGMYFVIYKHRGKFDGDYGMYYGGHWIKINYPNKYDAARGKAEGLITAQQETKIGASWELRAPSVESTALGGGIGFHGWIKEWDNRGPRHLSWGCVVMHIDDISRLYERIPEGTMVVIF